MSQNSRRTRSVRNYPAHTFQEALNIASYIQRYGSEGVLQRISLADHLNMSPKSSNFTTLLSAGEQYKITSGRYNDEFITLTDLSLSILSPRSTKEKNNALTQAIYAPTKFEEFNTLEKEHGVTDQQFLNSVVTRDLSIHPDLADEYTNIYRANRQYYESIVITDHDLSHQNEHRQPTPRHIQEMSSNQESLPRTIQKPEPQGQILIISLSQKTEPLNRTQEFLKALNLKVRMFEEPELASITFTEDDKINTKRVIIDLPAENPNPDLLSIGFTAGLSFGLSGYPPIITGSQTTLNSLNAFLEGKVKFIRYTEFNDMAVQLLLELQSSGNLTVAFS